MGNFNLHRTQHELLLGVTVCVPDSAVFWCCPLKVCFLKGVGFMPRGVEI